MSKVIIALDFSSKQEVIQFLKPFGQEKLFLKIGMELYYQEGNKFVKELKEQGHQIFLDLKLHDIPHTVYKAILNLTKLKVDLITVHALGGSAMLKAAQKAVARTNTKLLGVTVLTSLDEQILKNELGITTNLTQQVYNLAELVNKAGIYGIVCSPLEANLFANHNIICVTPGIRLQNDSLDDQKRIMTPKEALKLGSDFLVIGRSITSKENPYQVYQDILQEIK
ncbi:MAG: orotidine-5'-phosphate decarboxylase [Mycoplasmatales bacterium]